MAGARTISATPRAPIVTNHTSMIGPNIPPTRDVPCFWSENSAKRITTVERTTVASCRFGAAICKPSMAPRTEMAGVIIPSP